MTALMWFREDLRVFDNPALAAAARDQGGVVALWLATPGQWTKHDIGANRRDFLRRNVTSLRTELARRNITLLVRTVDDDTEVPSTVVEVAQAHSCASVHVNRSYGFNELQRDERVADACDELGIALQCHTDRCLFEPGLLRTGAGKFYSVFTPFFRAWCRRIEDDRSVLAPLAAPTSSQTERPADDDGSSDEGARRTSFIDDADADAARDDVVNADIVELWPAGEAEAKRRLESFISERARAYDTTRDVPSIDGTSRLSPYLSAGVISLRTCVEAAVRANDGALTGRSDGLATWIKELAWREFYQHVMAGFPKVSRNRAFKTETDRLAWNVNEEHFNAWCEGRTGVPIVDAAMRQLRNTGWMHNRLRMIVAMFFSKNLFLDWRLGERFFMQHLIDGDFASNNGGWQWAASTGTDAAPYFRIFNPIAQSKKFDPDGTFIRTFVPELAHVDAKAIHEPTAHGIPYIEPIVDLSETRRSAIAAFKSLRDEQ